MSYELAYIALQTLVISVSFVLFRKYKFNTINLSLLIFMQILMNVVIFLDADSRALAGVLIFSMFFLILNYLTELYLQNKKYRLKVLTRILLFVVMFLSACFTSFYLAVELYPKNQAW